MGQHCYSGGSGGGGCAAGAPLPLFLGKYFKKSPELAEIDKKKIGEKAPKPRAPPILQILDPPLPPLDQCLVLAEIPR